MQMPVTTTKPKKSTGLLETYTGRMIDPRNITPSDISINDISHHLSLRCRFSCACRRLYSVGQHSLLVSSIATPENALWGLLHDAGEYLLPDVPTPIKSDPAFKQLRIWELRTLRAIAKKFNLPPDIPSEIHTCDRMALATEARDLFDGQGKTWGLTERPLAFEIQEMTPRQVEGEFIRRFHQLIAERAQRQKEAGLGGLED